MLVYRLTYPMAPGNTESRVARRMLVEEIQRGRPPHAVRVYSSSLGRDEALTAEFEFESLAEYESFWDEWGSTPEADQFIVEHSAFLQPGITHEIWHLHYQSGEPSGKPLANRVTFPVRPGYTGEALRLLEEEMVRISPPNATRVYTRYIGCINTLAVESEFGSLGEIDKFWMDWAVDPEAAEFRRKHEPLVEHGIMVEVWRLRYEQ